MVRVGNDSESNFFGTRVPAVHNKKVPAMVRESFRVFWTRADCTRANCYGITWLIIGPSDERICRSFFSSAIEIFNFYTSFFLMLREKELHKMSR